MARKSLQLHRRKTRLCLRLFLPKSPELCQHRQVLFKRQHLQFFKFLLSLAAGGLTHGHAQF
jgi:hypothetical protein